MPSFDRLVARLENPELATFAPSVQKWFRPSGDMTVWNSGCPRRPGDKWFGSVSYASTRLQGNYACLTNSDITDGSGGRHAPNNGRAANVVQDACTAPLIQSDATVRHEILVSKDHENRRLALEINAANLFNQHSATAYYEFGVPAN